MFKLSKGAEYAIRGVLFLSMEPEGKVSYIEEIAEAQEVPKAYLAKIFQTLCKKGYLRSVRGPGGGFSLVRKPEEITALEIIEAMEGGINLNDCLIREGYCHRDKICPVHDMWKDAQKHLIAFLAGCNFKQLADHGKRKQSIALIKKAEGDATNS